MREYSPLNIDEWIVHELQPRACTSAEFIYDDMDSQSGRTLPIIYEPFDATRKSHWTDRGALYDYLFCTHGEGKRLLDFGPGDGWPSLIVAPFAAEVTGVDGSARRVQVCTENAARLGIDNASFVHVPPGRPLPFDNGTFDGVLAASSVEQTPDPCFTYQELYRVLKPGGRLRVHYEALGCYRGGQERDTWLWPIDDRRCRLILFDRHIDQECVTQYALTFKLPAEELCRTFGIQGRHALCYEAISVARLALLRPMLADARVCQTSHPSGATIAAWLHEIGFAQVLPTHDGIAAAGSLFDALLASARPRNLADVDACLRPVVQIVTQLAAPIELDPMLTAIKGE
ncbi:MAG TPA: class I SAM-dependent methyltransferase [Anaerolineae bacterium]